MNTRGEAEVNLNRMVSMIEAKHEQGATVARDEYGLASIAYSLLRIGDLLERRGHERV